jgi:tetratricopeptide (TPR) repeat protein
VLERQYAQARDVVVHQLARHYQEAGHTRKAAECYYLAGINAERLAANSVAIESYQNALALIPVDDWICRYTVLLALEQLYHRTGQRSLQEKMLAELSGIARKLDLPYQMQVKLLDADYALVRWDHKVSCENASTVISWAREWIASEAIRGSCLEEKSKPPGYGPLRTVNPDPKRLEVQGLILLGSYYSGIYYSDDETSKPRFEIAKPIMEQALELAKTRGFADLEIEIYRTLSLTSLGQDINEAVESSRKALKIARSIEDHYHESRILNALGLALSRQNEYIEGFRCHIQAKGLCREIGNRFDEGWAVHHLA